MTITTPTTELEAVNAMLATIGESPVNTLNTPGLEDATLAYTLLSNVCREVQSKGWKFNKEYEYPLPLNIDGSISIPDNAVQINVAQSMRSDWDVAWRQGKLYDRKNHTFNIQQNLPTGQAFKVDMLILVSFEDMPQPARWFVTVRAARQFLDRTLGNADLHGFTESDEQQALDILQEAEAEDEDANILTGNYSVYRTLDRGYNIYNTMILTE